MRYYPFFHIRLGHDFFANGICPAIRLEPTASTLSLMQHQRFRLVQKSGNYTVFYEAANPGAPLADLSGEDFELQFRLLVDQPEFYNYTDLAFDRLDSQIYHSAWRVNTDTFGFTPVTNAVVDLVDLTEESSEDPTNGIFLTIGMRKTDFGLLSIAFPAAAGNTSTWFNTETSPTLDLALSSRKTRWRYYLIPAAAAYDATSATILTSHEPADQSQFTRQAQNTELPDGSEAITLVSNGQRALREKYPANFTLKINLLENGTIHPISIPLPNPSPSRINAERPSMPREEITEFYSDQYIYL